MKLFALLVQQTQAPVPENLTVTLPPSFLATVEAIATIVLALAVLGVLFGVIGVLRQLKTLTRSVGDVAKRLEKDAGPVMERARSVAANVEFITAAVRTDVEKLNESVTRLNKRLKEASENMEERIQDFSALVEVIQGEAEELALDTAAAVRGVRAGTRALAKNRQGETPEGEDVPSGFLPGPGDAGDPGSEDQDQALR